MIGYLDILLRLTIWFLLTSDFSLPNMIIGVAIALLIPRCKPAYIVIKDWLQVSSEILLAIPIAFMEAIEIMIKPHHHEEIILQRVKPNRTPGLIFLDIFLITFTPKTIVLNYQEDGWYTVHKVTRRQSNQSNPDQSI